jgi:arylsulfatase A-like enzyme
VDATFFESVRQLRGLKGSAYEGGIRVPMIARWPGKVGAGTITDHISAFHDVMPTLCEVAGVPPSPTSNGISFLPTLIGNETQQDEHPFLFWEFHGYGGIQAVRFGDFKAVRTNCYHDPDGPIELFNLQTDLSEQHNLASQRPELVRRAAEIMITERGESALWDYSSPHPETTRK